MHPADLDGGVAVGAFPGPFVAAGARLPAFCFSRPSAAAWSPTKRAPMTTAMDDEQENTQDRGPTTPFC